MHRRALVWLLLTSPLWAGVLLQTLEARYGGGGGYSGGGGGGGGSSGGGGGGGDAGALIYLLVRLFLILWDAGPVGKFFAILLVIGVIVGFGWHMKNKQKGQAALGRQGRLIHSPTQQRQLSNGVLMLRQHDPNFSSVLFLDFAHLVFAKFHESRGGLARRSSGAYAVAPYLSPNVRQSLANSQVAISEVLVGSIEYGRIWVAQEKAHVAVRINANVVEAGVRTFLKQELTFRRPLHVITRPPEKVLELGCPNCGSPEEPKLDGSCPSCGSITGGGELDWQVVQISTHERAPVGPPVGSKGGAEVGTDLPTRYAMDLAAQKRALAMRDPAFQWLAFANRVKHMFMTLQDAWTNLDEKKVRPFVTDTHFDMIRYWIERMRSSGRRDVLEDIRIQRIEIAKIEHDVWYDAITVRIFASMIDYQVDNTGRVVSGRKGAQRAFSEYWTVIRRSDQAHTAARDPASCPSCGAPLDKINRAGICEYCGSKVVSGNFDWVLSIITQDEEYRG